MITRALATSSCSTSGSRRCSGLAEPIVAAVEERVSVGLAQTIAGARGTEKGRVLGTPAYMAPERKPGGEAVDKRADVFAFGVLLAEMLSGDLPFVRRGEIPSDSPSDWTKKAPDRGGRAKRAASHCRAARWLPRARSKPAHRRWSRADRATRRRRANETATPPRRARRARRRRSPPAPVSAESRHIVQHEPRARPSGSRSCPKLEPVYDEDSLRVEASPDGERLAFDSNRSGGFRVYVEPTAGGPAHLVSPPDLDCYRPHWSEDGRSLLVACGERPFDIPRIAIDDPGAPHHVAADAREAVDCGGMTILASQRAVNGIIANRIVTATPERHLAELTAEAKVGSLSCDSSSTSRAVARKSNRPRRQPFDFTACHSTTARMSWSTWVRMRTRLHYSTAQSSHRHLVMDPATSWELRAGGQAHPASRSVRARRSHPPSPVIGSVFNHRIQTAELLAISLETGERRRLNAEVEEVIGDVSVGTTSIVTTVKRGTTTWIAGVPDHGR